MKGNGIIIFTILVMLSMIIFPPFIRGESGSIDVPPDESRTVNIGNLITDSVLQYSWSTDDSGDKVDFKITDGTNDYEEENNMYGVSGSFIIPSNGNYKFIGFVIIGLIHPISNIVIR